MEGSKLTELMKSLTMHEVKAFRLYLSSPYFTDDGKLEKCFVAAHAFIMDDADYNRRDLHKKIFGQSKFHDQRIRHLLSDLTQHLEYFIMLKGFDKENLLQHNICARELAKRNCEKSYQYRMHLIKTNRGEENSNFYYQQFIAADQYLNYSGSKLSRKKKLDYKDVLFNLETFYLSRKLQVFCEVVNLKNILFGDFDLHLFDEISKLATKEPFSKIPAVQIYYYILLTLTDPENEKYFERLRELLKKHRHLFPVTELKDLYQYEKNYCVKKLNQGNFEYVKTVFEIYKTMLDDKRLMNVDYLSQWEFKNITSIGLRLNEKAWVKNFIHKYFNYLAPDERKNALTYNLAYWYFINDEFKRSIRQLQDVNFVDVYYQLDAKVILLKSYYEMEDTETLLYHASAFRLFLLRNRKISDYQRTINRNLIKYVTQLVRAGNSTSKIEKLQKDIAKEKNVADLNWLNDKINALI